MKTKQILTMVLCVLAIQVFAQTKLIAFKSHSGSKANFKHAYEKNMFNMGRSNFGQLNIIERERLDSVIFISDTSTVLVSTNGWNSQRSRDTIYNHPLYSIKNSAEKIKGIVSQQRYYLNSMETVAFVYYYKDDDRYMANNPKSEQKVIVNENVKNNVAPLLPLFVGPLVANEKIFFSAQIKTEARVYQDSLNLSENQGRIIPEPSVFKMDSVFNSPALFDMVLYPNPAKNNATLWFSNPDNETFSIRVYDVRGRNILSADKLRGTKFEIETSKFERGVYIVELVMNDIRASKRLVVQ